MPHTGGEKKCWKIQFIGYPPANHNEEAGDGRGEIIITCNAPNAVGFKCAQNTRSSEALTRGCLIEPGYFPGLWYFE